MKFLLEASVVPRLASSPLRASQQSGSCRVCRTAEKFGRQKLAVVTLMLADPAAPARPKNRETGKGRSCCRGHKPSRTGRSRRLCMLINCSRGRARPLDYFLYLTIELRSDPPVNDLEGSFQPCRVFAERRTVSINFVIKSNFP